MGFSYFQLFHIGTYTTLNTHTHTHTHTCTHPYTHIHTHTHTHTHTPPSPQAAPTTTPLNHSVDRTVCCRVVCGNLGERKLTARSDQSWPNLAKYKIWRGDDASHEKTWPGQPISGCCPLKSIRFRSLDSGQRRNGVEFSLVGCTCRVHTWLYVP
jgi:hypothetical protein